MTPNNVPMVSVIMGSISDAPVMKNAVEVLKKFGVPCEMKVVSAHRSPQWMFDFAAAAAGRGVKIIIAGAGGAAHLPGMIAALTTIPVIGVPVKSAQSMAGLDSLLSIVQMPNDVPVATVALNNAHNAGILAVQMLAIADEQLRAHLIDHKQQNVEKVISQNNTLTEQYNNL